MKKIIALILAVVIAAFALVSCDDTKADYTIGICNFVDDASLNQIIDNIVYEINALSAKDGVTVKIKIENCRMDKALLGQIISNFTADKVDLMVAVATPVAVAMQAATEDNKIPVVFAAVSDPVGSGVVDSLEKPGANLTGTSDYLDTNAVMDLIFVQNPNAKKIGLLYNESEEASQTSIPQAKAYLEAKGVDYVAKTGTNVNEIKQAASELIASGVDAIFTPQDNTVMAAELAIYESLADAHIPHYTGADSFALNGAFLGYGVDYANLGRETGKMIYDILTKDLDPANVAVKTFDNGTATINIETAEKLGLKFEELEELFKDCCTSVQPITTAEKFD